VSIDHDNHDLTLVSNNEKFTQLLTRYVFYAAPRMFALCQDPFSKDAEGWIFAWGVAFDDSAVLFNSNGKLTGKFNSADSALNLFSRTQKLRLIWVDQSAICDQSDAITT